MKSFLALASIWITIMFVAACSGGQQPPPPPPTPTPTATPIVPPPNGDTVLVNLEDLGGSGAYIFDPSEFTFSAGGAVTFTLTSETEFHTFTVDDLGIDVSVDARTTETLTFTFDQPGTFQLICIPHETLGMTGTITVQ